MGNLPENTAVACLSSLSIIRLKPRAAASASTDGLFETVTKILVDFLDRIDDAVLGAIDSMDLLFVLGSFHHCSIRGMHPSIIKLFCSVF